MKKTILENGLTVITKGNTTDNSVMLTYWVKAGGNNEKKYPYGIAHFLEHNMFKGTKNLNKEQITGSIDEIGGQFNASTSHERTNYYTIVPYTSWEVGTKVLSDMMFNSIFPEDEIEKEKLVVHEEIKRSHDNPAGYGYRVLYQKLMEKYPERQSVLGTPESVSSITRDDLVNFTNEFYKPKNMVFVATGNVDHDKLVSLLKELTPDDKSEVVSDVTKFEPGKLNSETINITKDTKQAHLLFAIQTTSGTDEEAYILDIISGILGGSMTSRLFKKIREEKGLAYTVSATNYGSSDFGFIQGYVGTDPNNLEEVKQIIKDELFLLKEELVGEKELNKVKNLMSGQFLVSNDSKSFQNTMLGMEALYGLGEDPKSYAEKLSKVTKEQIKETANKYFTDENILFVQVAPK